MPAVSSRPEDSDPNYTLNREEPVKSTRASSDWTNTVWNYAAPLGDARAIAQEGSFLYGGLSRQYGQQLPGASNGKSIPTKYQPYLSGLSVNFLKIRMPRESTQYPASGWILTMPAEWKHEILTRLADDDIDRDSVYPPLDDLRRLTDYVIGELVQ